MAQDLQTIDRPNTAIPWSEPELPKRLDTLVSSPLAGNTALSDSEALAVEHALSVYDQAPKGSTPRQLNRMMTKLALAYPSSRLSESEAAAKMELYEESLSDLDADLLAAGFRAAVKTCKFFPSVSELRELALAQPATPRFVRRMRLRQLLAAHRATPAIPAEPIATPDQIAAIKAELSEDARRMVENAIGQAA